MEIELKLAVAAKDISRLKRQDLLKAVRPARNSLYSIYFDTPEFDLYRRGVAFRLRRVGYHWVQTVKLAARSTGALSSRPEWEVQVTGNQPDLAVLPPEARTHLEDVAARLVPCFETDFRRTTWQLERGQGSVEVALDQGEVRAGEAVMPISEIKLELKAGDSAVLFEVANTLLAAGLPWNPGARPSAAIPCPAHSRPGPARPSARPSASAFRQPRHGSVWSWRP